MIEAQILKVLFPPDGAVPVDRLDAFPAIRTHIASIIELAAPKPLPPKLTKKRITRPEVSQETMLRIVELRDQLVQGRRRTWAEVAEELDLGLSAEAARHRYKHWKAREKKRILAGELYEAGAVEAAQEERSAQLAKPPMPPKLAGGSQEQQHHDLSPIDAAILGMADRGALNHEICIAIRRNFARNFSTGEIAERIRKLREGGA